MADTNSPITLLVQLGVNEKPSKDNIDSYIDKLSQSLKEIKLDLNIDGNLKSQFKPLQDEMKRTAQEAKEAGKKIKESFTFEGDSRSARRQLKEELDAQNRMYFDNHEELKKQLERQGFKVDIQFDAQTGEAEKAIATIKDSADELKRITFNPVEIQHDDGSSTGFIATKIKETSTAMHELDSNIKKTRDELDKFSHQGTIAAEEFEKFKSKLDGIDSNEALTQLNNDIKETVTQAKRTFELEDGIKKTEQDLEKLAHQGLITAERLTEMKNSLQGIDSVRGLQEFNRELQEVSSQTKRDNELQDASKRVIEQRDKALNQLIRTQKLYRKTFKEDEGKLVEEALNQVPTDFTNMREVKQAEQTVAHLRTQVQGLAADATEASKNSMGIAEAFKIAMERFPVWMAASTVFYGTVRGIRSAIQEIIELDSQMTVLRRVAGDGVNVNKVLEESVRLAKQLGNEITDINEGFIAFARQGFDGNELSMMTEYATLLGNISDLDVEESASILTAALKGFNIEAERGIHVVNALNEVNVSASLYRNVYVKWCISVNAHLLQIAG